MVLILDFLGSPQVKASQAQSSQSGQCPASRDAPYGPSGAVGLLQLWRSGVRILVQ